MRMYEVAKFSLALVALMAITGPTSAQETLSGARSSQDRLATPPGAGRSVAVGGVRRRHKRHAARIDHPVGDHASQDAVELAILAPPSRASTAGQTYGDAVYARDLAQGSIAREESVPIDRMGRSPEVRKVCDARDATSTAYVCGVGVRPGYATGYHLTPSYLSAPQNLAVPNDEQSPLLSPLTGLAWVVNSLRYDPHN